MHMEYSRHPLDNIYPNNNLLLLEAMIPYVEPSLRLPLALIIKMQEIRFILSAFHNPRMLRACGFDRPPANTEDMLFSMLQSMGMNIPEQFKDIGKMQAMMNQMSAMTSSEAMSSISEPQSSTAPASDSNKPASTEFHNTANHFEPSNFIFTTYNTNPAESSNNAEKIPYNSTSRSNNYSGVEENNSSSHDHEDFSTSRDALMNAIRDILAENPPENEEVSTGKSM